jgi:hypothetical protein
VGLPRLSARRFRTTWIVELMRDHIDPVVIADAAGMTSTAALARYQRFVPPMEPGRRAALLRGRRP